MCGFAGRFQPFHLPDAPGWQVKAGSLLAHRGPDDERTFRDDCCELVQQRLALLDPAPAGRQPMPW
jgi:asparagine synthetase B (glutamine-hydrolysing)